MTDKNRKDWTLPYLAGVLGGAILFGLVLIVANDFRFPTFLTKVPLSSDGHGLLQSAYYVLTPIAAGWGIYLLNKRTKELTRSNNQNDQRLDRDRLHQAVELMTSKETAAQAAGIASISSLLETSDIPPIELGSIVRAYINERSLQIARPGARSADIVETTPPIFGAVSLYGKIASRFQVPPIGELVIAASQIVNPIANLRVRRLRVFRSTFVGELRPRMRIENCEFYRTEVHDYAVFRNCEFDKVYFFDTRFVGNAEMHFMNCAGEVYIDNERILIDQNMRVSIVENHIYMDPILDDHYEAS